MLIFLLPGCATVGRLWPWKKKAPRATLASDHLLGTVSMVDDLNSFVLIDNGTLPSPASGTVLKIQRSFGAPVELRVTSISRPPYVVADIVKGSPKMGDKVYQ